MLLYPKQSVRVPAFATAWLRRGRPAFPLRADARRRDERSGAPSEHIEQHESGSARLSRNNRSHRIRGSGRRHGESRQRRPHRQGIHRRGVCDRPRARRRWGRQGCHGRRRCRGPARRRARVRSRDSPPARRSGEDSARGSTLGKPPRRMAEPAGPPQQSDRDLASIAEARALARRAKQAWLEVAEFDQARIDAIVDAMAAAATAHAEAFARLAVEETGYGVVEDKIQKNLFSSEKVYNFIRPMKTVGVIARHDDRRVVEIAEPFGVVAAIIPTTNPTSTAIYKILIAIKARCAIVLSPHPSAVKCITRVAEVMEDAARHAGAPAGAINWMTTVTLEGTQELMKQRDVAVILATGGMGLVRAAYSAGKPAYGVGPGNAPAFIERSANVKKAVHDVITGKTFDNGVLCSSENSVVVDEPIAEVVAVARLLVTPQRLPNPVLVGKSAVFIAAKCGVTVPEDTRVLLAPLEG